MASKECHVDRRNGGSGFQPPLPAASGQKLQLPSPAKSRGTMTMTSRMTTSTSWATEASGTSASQQRLVSSQRHLLGDTAWLRYYKRVVGSALSITAVCVCMCVCVHSQVNDCHSHPCLHFLSPSLPLHYGRPGWTAWVLIMNAMLKTVWPDFESGSLSQFCGSGQCVPPNSTGRGLRWQGFVGDDDDSVIAKQHSSHFSLSFPSTVTHSRHFRIKAWSQCLRGEWRMTKPWSRVSALWELPIKWGNNIPMERW